MQLFSISIKEEVDKVNDEYYDKLVLVVRHDDYELSEIVIGDRGIDMWYKDQQYAQIDFEKLQKLINEEQE